jgi:hypothetical protein
MPNVRARAAFCSPAAARRRRSATCTSHSRCVGRPSSSFCYHVSGRSLSPAVSSVVRLRGLELVFGGGLFATYELSIPLWEARLAIRQNLLDRLLDTGTIIQPMGGQQLTARVAGLCAHAHQVRAAALKPAVVLAKLASFAGQFGQNNKRFWGPQAPSPRPGGLT